MIDALVIFKPDGAHRLAVRAALWNWLSAEREWRLAGLTWYKPPVDLIEDHYDFLRSRPFFAWLVDFMSSLPVLVGRVTAEPDGLERMRYELGETRIDESRPGSLRELYGIGRGVNVLHLSDSPESGARETRLWSRQVSLDSADAQVDRVSDRPDHTFHLRSLAAQYAAGNHPDQAAENIKRLLGEEGDLTSNDLDALARIVLGAFRT